MNTNQDSPMKKFLKQVGNIVAVQAVAGAATELGKAVWPKVKEKLNAVLDKADELQKAKETRKGLNDLVKDTASHYKKAKQAKQAEASETPNSENPGDPPVDAKFTP
jgi:hypothetical protein